MFDRRPCTRYSQMGYDSEYLQTFAGGGIVGKGKCDKEFVQPLTTGPGVASTASDPPINGRFAAAIEASYETAAAPAEWPWALNKIAERFGDVAASCRTHAITAVRGQ